MTMSLANHMTAKTITITGTRYTTGLSSVQQQNFERNLHTLLDTGYTYLQHGDACGADSFAHDVALSLGFQIVIHPPSNSKHRAFCTGGIVRPVESYQVRNLNMVSSCDMVLALPNTNTEVLRSGTWQTVRMARQKELPIVIFFPDGRVVSEIFHAPYRLPWFD